MNQIRLPSFNGIHRESDLPLDTGQIYFNWGHRTIFQLGTYWSHWRKKQWYWWNSSLRNHRRTSCFQDFELISKRSWWSNILKSWEWLSRNYTENRKKGSTPNITDEVTKDTSENSDVTVTENLSNSTVQWEINEEDNKPLRGKRGASLKYTMSDPIIEVTWLSCPSPRFSRTRHENASFEKLCDA